MSIPDPTGWPQDAERNRLIGDWYIYQRKGGHRTSTDDLITAWYASHRTETSPQRYLDLGCGLGSVLLMIAHRLRPAVCRGVEAQTQSFLMAERAVQELPEYGAHIQLTHSDFRSFTPSESFDLITGSPPYFPPGTGTPPEDAQRLACRFEMRGGVEAYLEAASRWLSEQGRFYLVFQTAGTERVLKSAKEHALFLSGQADFLMREDRAEPFLTVFEFTREPVEEVHRFQTAVRDKEGEISSGYQRARAQLGVS